MKLWKVGKIAVVIYLFLMFFIYARNFPDDLEVHLPFQFLSKSKKDFRPHQETEIPIFLEKIPSRKEVEKVSNCHHTIYRDYKEDPVTFLGKITSEIECDIPCVKESNKPPDIINNGDPITCPHVKTFERTMENVGNYIGNDNHIAGNTHLDSDVVMQYFNWVEYDFMIPPTNKTGMVVAMISNCNPIYRLEYMKSLMDAGVQIDSYGSCNTNKPNGHRMLKRDVIKTYKFTFSFENSETDDYVTEKLFQPLMMGSVPIYYGAPNSKKFAPTNHSVIWVRDYESPQELAKYLIELDQDDKKYEEYLAWKKDGPSLDWIMFMDLGIQHSECRFCIKSADIDRKNIGEVVTGPYVEENKKEMALFSGKKALMLKVRERGTFYLRRIHLEKLTIQELKSKILQKYNDPTKGIIYSIYDLWDRNKTSLVKDEQLYGFEHGKELEIIFENPGDKRRGAFYDWLQKKKHKEFIS